MRPRQFSPWTDLVGNGVGTKGFGRQVAGLNAQHGCRRHLFLCFAAGLDKRSVRPAITGPDCCVKLKTGMQTRSQPTRGQAVHTAHTARLEGPVGRPGWRAIAIATNPPPLPLLTHPSFMRLDAVMRHMEQKKSPSGVSSWPIQARWKLLTQPSQQTSDPPRPQEEQ